MTQVLIDRATLEQLVVGLQRMSSACELEGDKHRDGNKWHRLCDDAAKAIGAGHAALAQQELPQKARPDFMAGYDAGMADAKRMAQQVEQQPVCHGCGIPAGDVHMSTCKSGKWPSRVSNGDTAAPAPACQVDRLQVLVEQGKEAQELAKIMKDFADKNPKSLMLKELDK